MPEWEDSIQLRLYPVCHSNERSLQTDAIYVNQESRQAALLQCCQGKLIVYVHLIKAVQWSAW